MHDLACKRLEYVVKGLEWIGGQAYSDLCSLFGGHASQQITQEMASEFILLLSLLLQ